MRYGDALRRMLICLSLFGATVTRGNDKMEMLVPAAAPAQVQTEAGLCDSDTLTNGFWGLDDRLAAHGIELALGSTNLYQAQVRQGTHGQSGRLTGSYDLEVAADFEKLLGLKGWGLFLHGEGGWPATAGIDETMVGSVFGVNADALGNRPLDVVEVILEWDLCAGFLALRLGKMDLTGVFDASAYANDETAQFLNGALVNNPTIPFPDYGLGVVVSTELTDWWHLAAGIGDAEADGRTTGFATAFGGESHFLYLLETAWRTRLPSPRGALPGTYRAGVWYDPQSQAHAAGEQEQGDGVGFYVSLDQMLWRESDESEDGQGVGVFGRSGYADATGNDWGGFWSAGLQYQGLWPRRDNDVLALGWACGRFSSAAATAFPTGEETVLESYYSVQVAPWVTVTPSLQYVTHPGGKDAVPEAWLVAVRAQIAF